MSTPFLISFEYSPRTEAQEISLPSHVYYSVPPKAHYFTAGCVRGGPSLWTQCRGCINQTSRSRQGSTHWHGMAHSTLEDKGKNTQPRLSLWNNYSFLKMTTFYYILDKNRKSFLQSILKHCSPILLNMCWHCPPFPFLYSRQQDFCMGKWHQRTVSEFLNSK